MVDATNLKLHLGLVLEMIELGRPILLVLNMMDEARRRGIQINTQKLSQRLGVPLLKQWLFVMRVLKIYYMPLIKKNTVCHKLN